MDGKSGAGGPKSCVALPLKRIRCAYVVEQMPTGVSKAWKVVGDDDEAYVVKFDTPSDHTALNELVCACIAGQLELPSFEPVLIDINGRQAAKINKVRAGPLTRPVDAGVHFAVRLVEHVYGAGSLEVTMGRKVSRDDLSNAGCIPGVLGFDTLVQNHDRHCGNVCFVFDADADLYSFRIMDHGHAFGGPSWSPNSIRALYQNLVPIDEFCLPTDGIDASRDFDDFLHLIESSIPCTLATLAGKGGVPTEWCTEDGGIVHIKHAIESLDAESLRAAIAFHLRYGGGA